MAINPTAFEIPEQMRSLADKSVDEARRAFDQFISAGQKALETAQGSARSAQEGMSDANRQALAYLEENVAASFDLAQRIVRAKTVDEIATLQQEFLRRQMEAAAAQGKAIGETFVRAANEAAKKPR
jgi:phasin